MSEQEPAREAAPDLDEEFAAIRSTLTEAQESVEDYMARLQGEDRSRIAKLIVWLFVVACIGALGFIALAALFGVAQWDAGAERMITILSSIILPVVTLVIGYYFGSETKQR